MASAPPDTTLEQQQDFETFYEQRIMPHIDAFEQKRLRANDSIAFRWKLALIPFFAYVNLAIYGFFVHDTDLEAILGIGFFVAGGIFYWIYRKEAKLQEDIKQTIFPVILSYYGEGFRYRHADDNPTDFRKLNSIGLLPEDDEHELGDYVAGNYRGVAFEMSELKLWEQSGRTRTLEFNGIVLSLSVKPVFGGRILLKHDGGKVGNFLSGLFSFGTSRLEFDDADFEKLFEVYGSDKLDAYTLVDRGWVEALKRIAADYDDGMQACFENDKLYLLLPESHDYLEVKSELNQAVTFQAEIDMIRHELQTIFEMIDIVHQAALG